MVLDLGERTEGVRNQLEMILQRLFARTLQSCLHPLTYIFRVGKEFRRLRSWGEEKKSVNFHSIRKPQPKLDGYTYSHFAHALAALILVFSSTELSYE